MGNGRGREGGKRLREGREEWGGVWRERRIVVVVGGGCRFWVGGVVVVVAVAVAVAVVAAVVAVGFGRACFVGGRRWFAGVVVVDDVGGIVVGFVGDVVLVVEKYSP